MQTHDIAERIINTLTDRGLTIATAESLTGGLVSASLVDIPGASDCMRGGVTTYQTPMKNHVLGVDAARLEKYGPVDPEVAQQMARKVADLFEADFGVSTTGVAGPGPSDGHPAGTVYVAAWRRGDDHFEVRKNLFEGDRPSVRKQSVHAALELVLSLIDA